jgi:hypothetical protein
MRPGNWASAPLSLCETRCAQAIGPLLDVLLTVQLCERIAVRLGRRVVGLLCDGASM